MKMRETSIGMESTRGEKKDGTSIFSCVLQLYIITEHKSYLQTQYKYMYTLCTYIMMELGNRCHFIRLAFVWTIADVCLCEYPLRSIVMPEWREQLPFSFRCRWLRLCACAKLKIRNTFSMDAENGNGSVFGWKSTAFCVVPSNIVATTIKLGSNALGIASEPRYLCFARWERERTHRNCSTLFDSVAVLEHPNRLCQW